MAVPWLTLLTKVPWQDVIKNAPKVVSGAQKLWNAVEKRRGPSGVPEAADAIAGADPDAPLATKVRSLEAAISGLHEQMRASSELIASLAEQNAQLIQRIETLRKRLLWLAGTIAALATALVVVVLRS